MLNISLYAWQIHQNDIPNNPHTDTTRHSVAEAADKAHDQIMLHA